MSGAVVGISGDLGDRFGRAAGPRIIEAGNRGRNAVASRRSAAPVPATAAVFTVALLSVFLLATRFAVPVPLRTQTPAPSPARLSRRASSAGSAVNA